MQFLQEEIEIAKRLHELGLPWKPSVGNFVFDATDFCQQPSPFQTGVYFILNYAYFMRLLGGLERFKENMIWLPTWDDIRSILTDLGLTDDFVGNHIQETRAIEFGKERLVLYELAVATLERNANRKSASVT
ncbi:MAG: hypothetical protein ABI557_16760 [Aureliella sp.]